MPERLWPNKGCSLAGADAVQDLTPAPRRGQASGPTPVEGVPERTTVAAAATRRRLSRFGLQVRAASGSFRFLEAWFQEELFQFGEGKT